MRKKPFGDIAVSLNRNIILTFLKKKNVEIVYIFNKTYRLVLHMSRDFDMWCDIVCLLEVQESLFLGKAQN